MFTLFFPSLVLRAAATDVFSMMGIYPGFTTKLPGVPGFDGELLAAAVFGARALVSCGAGMSGDLGLTSLRDSG